MQFSKDRCNIEDQYMALFYYKHLAVKQETHDSSILKD